MARQRPKPWHYFRAGLVERPKGRSYHWKDGYSRVTHGGNCQPWVTRQEARSEARASGFRAVLHNTEEGARRDFLADGDLDQGE